MAKKRFWTGALTGALTVLIVTQIGGFVSDKIKEYKHGRNHTVGVESGSKEDNSILAQETLEKIQTISQMIEQGYLFGDEIFYDEMEASAIKGYVQGLGDPYTVYYDAEETKALMEDTAGEFGGIGVAITQNVNTQIITFASLSYHCKVIF